MGKFFGTDGIRGIANKNLSCELALKVGMAISYILGKKSKILIGKDPRISSCMIESAIMAGISSMGSDAISLGIVPTPAVAYLVRKYKADAGIMISASHNSFEFNGIKIFDKNGFKLSDEKENEIESLISGEINNLLPEAKSIGKINDIENECKNDYVKYLLNASNISSKKNIKLLVDCSNGSSSFTAKEIFSSFPNIKADFIFNSPDGININENCGSTHVENLSKKVTDGKYDFAVAFDGDADRCLAMDELGKVIDGDIILGICAKYLKDKNELKNNALVGTIMSNMGLKKFCHENEINFFETKVGDRYVLEKMLESGYVLGGEQSGHVILLEHSTTGDGQLTALKLLEILSESNMKASELRNFVKKYPQKSSQVDIDYSQKGLLKKNKKINDYLEKLEKNLKEKGRIVVRESGTEPKIRIMVEHENESDIDKIINETFDIISKEFKN